MAAPSLNAVVGAHPGVLWGWVSRIASPGVRRRYSGGVNVRFRMLWDLVEDLPDGAVRALAERRS